MKDFIELYCGSCHKEMKLPFEESFHDSSTKCDNCGTLIYWHHCVDCETGYYGTDKDEPCPECTPRRQ